MGSACHQHPQHCCLFQVVEDMQPAINIDGMHVAAMDPSLYRATIQSPADVMSVSASRH